MKVSRIELKNFMLFEDVSIDWSPNINIISGGNSTGKTALLKLLYALLTIYRQSDLKSEAKDKVEARLVEKLTHVFRPENMNIGRLVRRKQGSNRTDGRLIFDKRDSEISFGFSNRAENHMDFSLPTRDSKPSAQDTTVYFPPKEIISSTENFRSLYEDMHIAFEEMYYDLARLLDRPLKKGKNTDEQNKVLSSLGGIMQGSIVQRENKFYLSVVGNGEFEMGLVSEGYRKLATIIYLILNGALNKSSALFWDEPETNMNPKMIRPLVEAVVELAKMGVQVFITTHDYFLQQYFNMYMAYPETNPDKLDIRFISLYKDESEETIRTESANTVSDLEHNTIMEEFDEIYNREQGIIHERIRERH